MTAAIEDDIDFETLQAQLDKTWAYAHSVVDGWMKPGKGAGAAPTMSDKEMNDLLRRPSRLGVGAPMPDSASSSVTSAREALKLKYKLEGKEKKKRARDEDEKSGAGSKGGEEDEEESRASAIRKKPRLDPFASPGGKKRKAEKMGAPHAKEQVEQQPMAGPSTLTAETPTTNHSPERKKKKKLRELSTSQDESDTRHYSPAVSATPSNAASSLKATSPDSIPAPLPAPKHTSKPDKDNAGLPILNLDGPPPSLVPSSPSKRSSDERKRAKNRRKREKKKAKKAETGVSAQGEGESVSDRGKDSGTSKYMHEGQIYTHM